MFRTITPDTVGCKRNDCQLAGTVQCDYCTANPQYNHNQPKPTTLKHFSTRELIQELHFRFKGERGA